jgi:hypothetical protein
MFRIDPQLQDVLLKDLRPTQMTIGLREVDEKRKDWAKLTPKRRRREMSDQLFPAVKGPRGRLYVLDHHHLALALLREKVDKVRVGFACDLSELSPEDFWIYLDHRSWVHCYDASGFRQPFDHIPKTFEAMKNDPYRSLASSVQKLGGFAKPEEPFLEFLWANYFRRKISIERVEDSFEKALAQALQLSRLPDTSFLPGWSGTK